MFSRKGKIQQRGKAQTATEYLILLAIAVALVLFAFKDTLPEIGRVSNAYFGEMAGEIMGEPPVFCPPIDVTCEAITRVESAGWPPACPPAGASGLTYQFAAWQTADVWNGDNPYVRICCSKDIHLASVQSAPFPLALPSCPADQTIFAQYKEGGPDYSDDDAAVTLCVDENSFPEEMRCTGGAVQMHCTAQSVEEHETMPECLVGFRLVSFCTGDCTEDDARVQICCGD